MRILLICSILFTLGAHAQEGIMAKVEDGKTYIEHTVTAGETLSLLSRKFNVGLKELAAFNKIDADKGLQKDKAIRIPLSSKNIATADCGSCKKMYYKVQPKDGLYRIGVNFGNQSTAALVKLNKLPSEAVNIGQDLLVGYLKNGGDENVVAIEKEKPKEVAITKVVEPKKTVISTPKPVAEEPPVEEKPKAKMQEPVEEKLDETKVIPIHTTTPPNVSFELLFTGNAKVLNSGQAAIFKSTSGWQDGKYYALMSGVAPGTILKISSTQSNKVVYAKVLAELPDLKQNEGILLRISNAAASALGSNEETMPIMVSY